MLYRIVRVQNDVIKRIIARNLTVQNARKLVNRNSTHQFDKTGELKWFHRYEEQSTETI